MCWNVARHAIKQQIEDRKKQYTKAKKKKHQKKCTNRTAMTTIPTTIIATHDSQTNKEKKHINYLPNIYYLQYVSGKVVEIFV